MKGQKTLFSHKSDEWETPQYLFDELNKEFNFVFDLAATKENSKTGHLFSSNIDKLNIDDIYMWAEDGFFLCNPPYSQVTKFLAFRNKFNIPAVFLIFARTDTKWFHEYVYNKPNVEIRFIKGRLKFSGSKNSAPAPSMIVIFR